MVRKAAAGLGVIASVVVVAACSEAGPGTSGTPPPVPSHAAAPAPDPPNEEQPLAGEPTIVGVLAARTFSAPAMVRVRLDNPRTMPARFRFAEIAPREPDIPQPGVTELGIDEPAPVGTDDGYLRLERASAADWVEVGPAQSRIVELRLLNGPRYAPFGPATEYVVTFEIEGGRRATAVARLADGTRQPVHR